MIKIGDLLIGAGMFLIAHILTFYQLNGQFIWKSFQKYEWVVATCGIVLSFFYIWGTKYAVSGMGGLLWPARFIGFGIGMIVYALFVGFYFNEGISAKTLVSLCLSLLLVCIQVLWK
jgi:hypothetical protein|tara:strand:+ start:1298 stop:1648 length:351 start_codon:yes stop_codon:yes gene_type:complete